MCVGLFGNTKIKNDSAQIFSCKSPVHYLVGGCFMDDRAL